MSTRLPTNPVIAALCVALLLLVQVSGLHQHRHVEVRGAPVQHGVQLHFEDAGIHGSQGLVEHSHADAVASPHPHVDIETKVVGDGVAKVLSLLLSMALVSLFSYAWPRRQRLTAWPSYAPVLPRRSRIALLPPSQAPPRVLPLAV